MLKTARIEELRNVDIRTVDKTTLADASMIVFDNSLPQDKRMTQILRATKNPYCFRFGDMAIKIEFPDNAPPLQNTIEDFLIRQKSGL